jgi:6-phosphogluconolactonase
MRNRKCVAASVLVVGLASVAGVLAGCSGSDGATGPAGPQGTTGDPAATGTAGATGATGPAGATGAAGTQGPAGATGAQGPTGASAPSPEAGTGDAPNAVYMISNDPTQNEIIEFARATDGSLTPFGSFPTGGAGTGAGLGDQGALAFDAATNRFFAVNAGDNSISMLELETDGTISLLSKIGSGGVAPNSITVSGDIVYALNSGSATSTPNVSGFKIDPAGLVTIPGSIQPLSGPSTVGAAQILFAAAGSALVVTERLANNIDTYAVTAGVAGAPSVFAEPGPVGPTPGSEPFGFAVSAGGQIVVSEAWSGAAGLSSTSSFSVSAAGALTEISTGVTSGQAGACWTAIVGTYAYETNTASGTLSQFSVAANGALTLVGNGVAGAAGGAGTGPTDVTGSADGKYIYVHDGTGALSIFAISATDGTLTKSPDFVGIPAHAEGLIAR